MAAKKTKKKKCKVSDARRILREQEAQKLIDMDQVTDEALQNAEQNGIIFIDEINRTENTVYKELMNILLTRSVNGYQFPWWVLFVGAMNPSTQNSVYATNEMDPAQLDRFLIKTSMGYPTAEEDVEILKRKLSPQRPLFKELYNEIDFK